MKILVQADGIQLTPESDADDKLLAKLAKGCELYRIDTGTFQGKFVGWNTHRLVKKERKKELDVNDGEFEKRASQHQMPTSSDIEYKE